MNKISITIGFFCLSIYSAHSNEAVILTAQDALNPRKAGLSAVFRPIIKNGETVEYWMGSPKSEAGRFDNEILHRVKLTKPFAMQATPVTVEQYQAIVQRFDAPRELLRHPVVEVSWDEAQKAVDILNSTQKEHVYSLPTEAQYEYAARGGLRNRNFGMPYFFGSDKKKLDRYAWYWNNSQGKRHPVGMKKANPFGLYDILGNVWHWVKDRYDYNYGLENVKTLAVDPEGPSAGWNRVQRGGGWINGNASRLRSAFRDGFGHNYQFLSTGFRLVRSLR